MVPPGYERIGNSIIAVQRGSRSFDSYVAGESIIDEILIVLTASEENSGEDEEFPDGYDCVSFSNGVGYCGDARNANATLAVRYRNPMGIADTRFKASVLDRYPLQDIKQSPLPANELPTFVFPHALRLKFSTMRRFPLPTFFTFVFTDAKGGHMYAACLRFYEELTSAEVKRLLTLLYGIQDANVLDEVTSRFTLFCPKVICILSSYPFYRGMRSYLRQIYSLSLSTLICPIEFFISSLVSLVAVPLQGGRPFHYIQDASLISEKSRTMPAIVFDLPPEQFFPCLDLDFSGPLRCLSIENLLVVFTLLLHESKCVFLCSSNNMITETMECFRALLFPLKWATTFISRLPDSLTGLFQALGGFMFGFSEVEQSNVDVDNMGIGALHDQHYSETLYCHQDEWIGSLTPSTYIVDLSNNKLFKYDGETPVMLSSAVKTGILNLLPLAPKMRLWQRLQKICIDYSIGPQRTEFQQFDSAFDIQMPSIGMDDPTAAAPSTAQWEKFPTLEIRDSFMALMVELLGEYERFITQPDEQMTKDSFRSMHEEFNIAEYIASAEPSLVELRTRMVETQAFEYLLQRRAEGDASIAFFERAAALQRELQLNARITSPAALSTVQSLQQRSNPLATSQQVLMASNGVSELPALLHKLLAANEQIDREKAEGHMQIALGLKKPNINLANNSLNGVALSPMQGPPSPVRPGGIRPSVFGGPSGNNASPMLTPQQQLQQQQLFLYTTSGNSLAEIMSVVKAMDFNDVRRAFEDEEVASNPSLEHRSEHAKAHSVEELHLCDKSLGALIIPGPSPIGLTINEYVAWLQAGELARVADIETVCTSSTEHHHHMESSPKYPRFQHVVISDDSVRFHYSRGWPRFNHAYLNAGIDHGHIRLAEFRKERMLSTEMVSS
jgi:hypothetical protein